MWSIYVPVSIQKLSPYHALCSSQTRLLYPLRNVRWMIVADDDIYRWSTLSLSIHDFSELPIQLLPFSINFELSQTTSNTFPFYFGNVVLRCPIVIYLSKIVSAVTITHTSFVQFSNHNQRDSEVRVVPHCPFEWKHRSELSKHPQGQI